MVEERYPNGFLKAEYVFKLYEDLDPVEKTKLISLIGDDKFDEYYQANYDLD